MTGFRLAALDLDGTLVDSAPDLVHCLGEALDQAGLSRPGLAEARAWIGDGIETLVRRALQAALDGAAVDAELLRRTLAAFDRCYAANLYRESRLFPGVQPTLRRLRDAGIVLGCITNKRERFARAMLAAAGIDSDLQFVYGGDSFARRKPDPLPLLEASRSVGIEPSAAVMIGDSINDRDAAAAAGFAFVLAAYGYVRGDELDNGTVLARIADFAELGPLLCGP